MNHTARKRHTLLPIIALSQGALVGGEKRAARKRELSTSKKRVQREPFGDEVLTFRTSLENYLVIKDTPLQKTEAKSNTAAIYLFVYLIHRAGAAFTGIIEHRRREARAGSERNTTNARTKERKEREGGPANFMTKGERGWGAR